MSRSSFLATAALGVTLTLGAVGVGTVVFPAVASAQETVSEQVAGRFGHRHPRLREVAKEELQLAADTIGIPADELRVDLKDGQSIADVATAKGVEPSTVVDAVVSDLDARLDTRVQEGKLSQERADRIEQRLPTRVENLVNRHRVAGSGD